MPEEIRLLPLYPCILSQYTETLGDVDFLIRPLFEISEDYGMDNLSYPLLTILTADFRQLVYSP